MLGNFSYKNATKLYFGDDSLKYLNEELPKYGKTVQLIYGGGSIKKNGVYDEIVKILQENGKTIVEDSGVMPNPTIEKLREGIKIARDNNVALLLAVGGGSCCDYAKAVSVSVNCDEDPWDKYYLRFEEPTCEILPVGCILTMAGTGSEMNAGAVITNHEQKRSCRSSRSLIRSLRSHSLRDRWSQAYMTSSITSVSSISQEKTTIRAIILQKL